MSNDSSIPVQSYSVRTEKTKILVSGVPTTVDAQAVVLINSNGEEVQEFVPTDQLSKLLIEARAIRKLLAEALGQISIIEGEEEY